MASPVKLAPAAEVWVNALAVVGTPFQAEIEPFRLAKMKLADLPFPPLLTSKPSLMPAIAFALATCPVGPTAAPVVVGMFTVKFSETPVLPTTEGRMDVLVAWFEIQMGLPF